MENGMFLVLTMMIYFHERIGSEIAIIHVNKFEGDWVEICVAENCILVAYGNNFEADLLKLCNKFQGNIMTLIFMTFLVNQPNLH
jgi:hypothetical protein